MISCIHPFGNKNSRKRKDATMKAKFKLSIFIVLLVFLVTSLSSAYARSIRVRGYYRKDGTYVRSHYRSAPDGNFYNNWSTKGNVNPYTGKPGTKVTPPSTYRRYPYSRRYSPNIRAYTTPYYQSTPTSSYNPSSSHSSGYSGVYRNDSYATPVAKPFIVYFRTGRKLVCDYAWIKGNNILLVMHGKEFVIRYDESEIDMKKSFK